MIENILTGTGPYFQLARFIGAVVIGLVVTRALLMPAAARLMRRRGSDKKALHSIENLVGISGLFLTMLVALQAASFGGLATVLGALAAAATVAIGFGMRDQVSSVVAGVFIHTDNPFVKGDYISVNDIEGKVKEIRLRATKLNTGKDEKIVPNNMLTTNVVRNFTRGNRTSDSVSVKVPVDRAEQAADILVEAVKGNENVLEKPEPGLKYTAVEEDKVELRASYWARDSIDIREVRSQVLREYTEKARSQAIYEKEEEE